MFSMRPTLEEYPNRNGHVPKYVALTKGKFDII